jgi:arylsulfatase
MTDRPNIILIFPDQWRFDCLSCLGHPSLSTPFLDRIANEGTLFERAYSNSPTCIPARACLATGLSPHHAGRVGYCENHAWDYPHTWMRCLRDDGYQTMLVGKSHFAPMRAHLGFEQSRMYEASVREPGFVSDYHRWLERETKGLVRDTALDINPNTWYCQPWTADERLHPNAWSTDQAVDLIRDRDPTRPFAMQLAYHRPHPPIDPPWSWYQEYRDMPLAEVPVGDWAQHYDQLKTADGIKNGRLPERELARMRRGYFAQIAHLDRAIGRLYEYLRTSKTLGNTWLVFCSDHGEMLGDHHQLWKASPFEGAAHIPMIVRAPDGTGRGQRSQAVVGLHDILPTFHEIAGCAVPEQVDGSSLIPLMQGTKSQVREWMHGEHAGADGWQFVTDGAFKFAWESRSGKEFAFDLVRDPRELHNLAADPGADERVELWRQRLIGVLAERPEDGLSDGTRLIAGTGLKAARPWVPRLAGY